LHRKLSDFQRVSHQKSQPVSVARQTASSSEQGSSAYRMVPVRRQAVTLHFGKPRSHVGIPPRDRWLGQRACGRRRMPEEKEELRERSGSVKIVLPVSQYSASLAIVSHHSMQGWRSKPC
jgi:hypothetical protein